MNTPKHQHFIPKSYLKNFSLKQDDKFFVEGKLKDEDQPKSRLISIKDICVDKNLYTIPDAEGDEKYALEKYYANEVDSIYPEVYKLLTDNSVKTLTELQRRQIIMTTMSLFFRTPKFLNSNQRRTNLIIDYAIKNHTDKNGHVRFKHNSMELDFNIKDEAEIRIEHKLKNKIHFLESHLKDWFEFTKFKMNCGLEVITIKDDMNLITSDNPVDMHSVNGGTFNIFDPTNMVSVPIDNKHYLIIYPNTESNIKDLIFRGERDKRFVLTRNYCTEENSEEWILGVPSSITSHIKDQIKYGEQNEENEKMVDQMKEEAYDARDLQEIIDRNGLYHSAVAKKLKELLEKPMHQNNIMFKKIELSLREKGLLK